MMVQGKKGSDDETTISTELARYEDMIAAGHVEVIEQQSRELQEDLVLPELDVKALRKTFGLSQHDFAFRYGIPLAALRNWEQKRRRPDTLANILLHMIKTDSAYVAEAIAKLRGVR